MLELAPAGDILGAMITPAVLISACGTLALSTSNRLGRVVDRVRALSLLAESLPDGGGLTSDDVEKRALLADQLLKLSARITLLQSSLTILYAAIGLWVATSLTIGLTKAIQHWLEWIPVVLGMCGATALFFATILLVRETRIAVKATLVEMAYIRRMVARKTGAPISGVS